MWHETGGAGANAGVQLTEIGARRCVHRRGVPRRPAILAATCSFRRRRWSRSRTHITARAGVVFPQDEAQRDLRGRRASTALRRYLDGARLWNAAVASGDAPSDLAAPFDLVSVALSKGLGAPGARCWRARATMDACVRHRRMLGGAMRQVGIFAAAGLHALDHHMERLSEDHDNAARIARRLVESPRVWLDGQPFRPTSSSSA